MAKAYPWIAKGGVVREARIRRRHPEEFVTRFQRLAAATVIASFVLVVIGVAVRATDSGVACPHWPGCFEGQFLPGPGRRVPGLDRVDPSIGCGPHRRADPGHGGTRRCSTIAIGARSSGRRSRPSCSWASRRGSAARPFDSGTRGSRSRRTLRPRWRSSGCSSTCWCVRRIPARLGGGGQPAVHAPCRVRRGRDVRAAALRLERHGAERGTRLRRLAAHGRLSSSRSRRRAVRTSRRCSARTPCTDTSPRLCS